MSVFYIIKFMNLINLIENKIVEALEFYKFCLQ